MIEQIKYADAEGAAIGKFFGPVDRRQKPAAESKPKNRNSEGIKARAFVGPGPDDVPAPRSKKSRPVVSSDGVRAAERLGMDFESDSDSKAATGTAAGDSDRAVAAWWSGGESGWEAVNAALRRGKDHPAVAGLHAAIARSEPLATARVLYRGLILSAKGREAVRLQRGDSVTDAGFVAVTSDSAVAERFPRPEKPGEVLYVVEMVAPVGTRLAAIPSGMSEYLLPAGNRYVVDRVVDHGDIGFVRARYVEDGQEKSGARVSAVEDDAPDRDLSRFVSLAGDVTIASIP